MKYFLLFLVTVFPLLGQTTADYKKFISSWEGMKTEVYKDKGGWAVGIGHHFSEKPTKLSYSMAEVDAFFYSDLQTAISTASKVFPSFSQESKELRLILVDLSFNLGETRLSKFVKFRAAIAAKDYKKASVELKDSLWYNQTGRRGKHHVNAISSLQ
jgi:lysozyme